jgi:hypothetical protein
VNSTDARARSVHASTSPVNATLSVKPPTPSSAPSGLPGLGRSPAQTQTHGLAGTGQSGQTGRAPVPVTALAAGGPAKSPVAPAHVQPSHAQHPTQGQAQAQGQSQSQSLAQGPSQAQTQPPGLSYAQAPLQSHPKKDDRRIPGLAEYLSSAPFSGAGLGKMSVMSPPKSGTSSVSIMG